MKQENSAAISREDAACLPVVAARSKQIIVFFIRLGGKPIEFEKGKAGIVAQNAEKLTHVVNTVMAGGAGPTAKSAD